ncbi:MULTISPECIES: tyrosine-type recombinase/integrase [Enterococcus]|uniref:tyrosine-type recombinase/integrase n=1 Tax=Enterococcus TaxID=1350 RepID=UPI00115BCFCC|nr:site-specific integrase [Enterococcus faecium]MBD9831645.1 site-specific integrase [Enterococcus faecium]MBD9904136.1 site-specific integrase [Enterococcus faecium]MBE8864141.1 site-specific integrase [Enterococcus faecium]MBW4157624.1 site-specific integrase [Enterococcus faecium]MCA6712788.1 site-specific integrase [Enterococcus faecium]
MAITKLKNNHYKLEVFYSKEVRQILGVTTERYRKTFRTKKEAEQAEKDLSQKIQRVLNEKSARSFELNGHIKFKEFYETVWLDMYIAGSTGRSRQIPTATTISNTKDVFRLHILPMFGEYSIKFLNDNKDFVLRALMKKSQTYANIKIIKSYVNQIFDIAELLEYIEYNRIEKVIRYVGDPKKQQLKAERQLNGEALTAEELIAWLDAANEDYSKGLLIMQDYVLLMLTLNLGDRKSESYALQWKHIDFENGYVSLIQSKDKFDNLKSTKGRKATKFKIPTFLIKLLKEWKQKQKEELLQLGIKQTKEQFLFTYANRSGEVNIPVHVDYLNYRLKSIRRRHEELTQTNPHKLRHTFSTLAREGGATMAQISQALTHSDIKTTEIYVNTPNVVDLSTYEKFEKRLDEARQAK